MEPDSLKPRPKGPSKILIWNMSMYDLSVPQGDGIITVLVKKCCPGPPGLIHFWMQAPSKNRLKPGGCPGGRPPGKPLIGASIGKMTSSLRHNNNNNNNNNGITQEAFPQSGSSSTWRTNGFTSLSKDGVAKEDHLNIQPHGQAGNRTRDFLASSYDAIMTS